MIVVLGSRHDPVAVALVDAWPSAELCSAEDLTQPGWAWRSDRQVPTRWVVDGARVDDDEVTGVFIRRAAVYPEELLGTDPDDRPYLAAEAQAFLACVLATTRATVANPVVDGCIGDETLHPGRWMVAATELDIPVAPLRLASDLHPRRRLLKLIDVEVVGGQALGDASPTAKRRAVALVRRLELVWAVVAFDGRLRAITVTCARRPGPEATDALGRLLAAPPA